MTLFKHNAHIFAALGSGILFLTIFFGMLWMTDTAHSAETTPVLEAENAITFTFTEDDITTEDTDSSAYQISDQKLTIYKSGTYVLTGSSSNATVKVAKGTSDVILVLDNLSLSNEDGAVFKIGKISEVSIVVQGDNTLSYEGDGGAAIKIKSGATVDISGDGQLTINAEDGVNGIQGATGASLTVSGIALDVDAAEHAISVDGSITLVSGVYNLTSGNEAIQSMPEDGDINSDGTIAILGGTYTITAEGDGVQARDTITIGIEGESEGPSLQINTSSEALEADDIILYSGNGTLVSDEIGVNAVTDKKSSITIDGGEWTIRSNDEGLLANGELIVNGGTTNVYTSAGTSEATINGGSFNIYDDTTETTNTADTAA